MWMRRWPVAHHGERKKQTSNDINTDLKSASQLNIKMLAHFVITSSFVDDFFVLLHQMQRIISFHVIPIAAG